MVKWTPVTSLRLQMKKSHIPFGSLTMLVRMPFAPSTLPLLLPQCSGAPVVPSSNATVAGVVNAAEKEST